MLWSRYSKILHHTALIVPSGAFRKSHTHKMSECQELTMSWPWHIFDAGYWFVAYIAPRERVWPCWQSLPCQIKFLYWAGLGEIAFRNTHLSYASPLVNEFDLGDRIQCTLKGPHYFTSKSWWVDIKNWSERTTEIRPDGNCVKCTDNMSSLRHVLPNTFRILGT